MAAVSKSILRFFLLDISATTIHNIITEVCEDRNALEGASHMQNQLFRQKSLERIQSPEEMHDYMRVTSPRLWMILAAIVILLAGFIAYASTTTMESTVPIKVHVDVFEYRENDGEDSPLIRNYSIYADIPTTMKDVIDNGKVVRIGDSVTGKVYYIGNSRDDECLNVLIDLDSGSSAPKAGDYDAVLVLESKTPISFLWNN